MGSAKLSETMQRALGLLYNDLKHQKAALIWPNENTGRALEARGLVEVLGRSGSWALYGLTETGRAAVAGIREGRQ